MEHEDEFIIGNMYLQDDPEETPFLTSDHHQLEFSRAPAS